MSNRPALFLATGFGLGYIPIGPGTFASVAALGTGYLVTVHNGFSPVWLALVAMLLVLPAVWISDLAVSGFSQKDPQVIVIDEFVGQLFAVSATTDSPLSWVCSLALFRILDILKPYPIKRLERLPGGLGIVADDVAAGVCAMMILAAARWLTS